MHVRGVLLTLTLAASLLAVVPPANAVYEDLKFTTIVTDAADVADAADILSLAVAEPGDATLVVRYEVGGWQTSAPPPPGGVFSCSNSVDFFYDATPQDGEATAFRSVMCDDGSVGSDYTSCEIDGNFGYCILPYEVISLAVGDTIAGPSVNSYYGTIVDCAPGPVSAACLADGGVGTDYVLTGCSALSCGGVNTGAGIEKLALAAAAKTQTVQAGSDAVFNLTVTNLGIATNFTLGTVGLPSTFSAAFSPLTGDLAGNGTATAFLKVSIPASATPGSFPFKAKVTSGQGANATVDLKVEVTKKTGPTTGPTGSTTSQGPDDFTGTGETSKAAPGVEFLVNIVAIGLLVVALRRRVE